MRDRDLIFDREPAIEWWRVVKRPWIVRSERRRTAAERRRRYEALTLAFWMILYVLALSPLAWAGLR